MVVRLSRLFDELPGYYHTEGGNRFLEILMRYVLNFHTLNQFCLILQHLLSISVIS